MQYKQVIFSAVFLLGFALTGLQAQESLNTTGGNASGSGGSISYSIGQVVYTTNTSTDGTLTQGVQQPYEILVTGIEDIKGISLAMAVYPNPTTDLLQLKVENKHLKDLSIQLFDTNGKLLQMKKLIGTDMQIDMRAYAPSTYFLIVNSDNQSIKEFKIVKR